MKTMRTMLMIAFTMFSLAGCATEVDAPSTKGDAADTAMPEPDTNTNEATHADRIPGEEIEEEPLQVTRCMTNEECQRVDEETEYHMCDVASGVCIRSPYPF